MKSWNPWQTHQRPQLQKRRVQSNSSNQWPCNRNRWIGGTYHIWLVVDLPTPLKNDGVKVSWDDDIPKMMGKSFKIPWFQSPPTSSEVYFSGLCKFPLIQLQLLGPDLWQRTRHIIHAALQILRTRCRAVSTEIPSDWINNKNNTSIHTMWGPRSISKLVNITPMSLWFMVLITRVTGAFVNQLTSLGGLTL